MQFGIWHFDASFGLVARLENFSEYYISTERIWETEDTNQGQVWKWPIYFTTHTWFTPGVADDFNKAFFYAQNYLEGKRPENLENSFDFDSRTIALQSERLKEFSQGSQAGPPVEA